LSFLLFYNFTPKNIQLWLLHEVILAFFFYFLNLNLIIFWPNEWHGRPHGMGPSKWHGRMGMGPQQAGVGIRGVIIFSGCVRNNFLSLTF
jgi:hypothetical protein